MAPLREHLFISRNMRYNTYDVEGNCMLMRSNLKAVSTLAIVLLMIVSAIIGGLLSYMFTIAFFIKIPEKTTVTITDVYFDKGNARSFIISLLNPSYSPTNATVIRIALSLKEESQLYDVVSTEPSIENGIVIQKGETLNITCREAHRDSANVPWGKLAGEFAGENITVHVFSPDSTAANIEASVPFVKLQIIDPDFNSKVSLSRFNITVGNHVDSEVNLTISELMVGGIGSMKDDISPTLPTVIANGTYVHFNCNGSWRNLMETTLTVSTEEGYVFSQEFELPKVYTTIQNVIFNEDDIQHFNVSVFNSAESANYVNVTKIAGTLENGTTIKRNYASVGIARNSTGTFTFDWNWKEYREKRINVTAFLLQDFETDTFTVTTPPPVIFTVLNEKEVFDLKDKTHFNITLQNHPSSIEAVNITKIVVKETGDVINSTKANPELPSIDPIQPGQSITFYCNITDWTDYAGKNLTLIIHAVNETSEKYTFEFTLILPMAKLNITRVIHTEIAETKYLNITIENLNYSVWNLTISKVIITLPNQPESLEQQFPENLIILKPNESAVLLCVCSWEAEHLGENITVTVVTKEGIEVSWQGTNW
jgi:hypothetical protein